MGRLLCALLLLFTLGCAPRTPKVETTPAPRGKEVVITDSLLVCGGSDTLRLGRLGSGEQALVRFSLRNQSTVPLVILSHELTCGCIELHYENKPVAVGGYLPVEMQFDSRGLYGWQLKLFYLRLHGSDHPLKCYVEAIVE